MFGIAFGELLPGLAQRVLSRVGAVTFFGSTDSGQFKKTALRNQRVSREELPAGVRHWLSGVEHDPAAHSLRVQSAVANLGETEVRLEQIRIGLDSKYECELLGWQPIRKQASRRLYWAGEQARGTRRRTLAPF